MREGNGRKGRSVSKQAVDLRANEGKVPEYSRVGVF